MLLHLVDALFNIYLLGLIVYAVSTWIDHPIAFRLRAFLIPFYRPFLEPIQRMLRSFQGDVAGIDFSPLILGILIVLVRQLVEQALFRILYL